jgi:hypothetical protein
MLIAGTRVPAWAEVVCTRKREGLDRPETLRLEEYNRGYGEVRAPRDTVKQRSRRSRGDDTDNRTKRDRQRLVPVAFMKE